MVAEPLIKPLPHLKPRFIGAIYLLYFSTATSIADAVAPRDGCQYAEVGGEDQDVDRGLS
jgi:hypothetical protein